MRVKGGGGFQLMEVLTLWTFLPLGEEEKKKSMVREEIFFTISRWLKGRFSITNLFLAVQIAQIEKGKAMLLGMLGWMEVV